MKPDSTRTAALQSAAEVVRSLGQKPEETLAEPERVAALRAAQQLVATLEKPEDEPVVWMAMRICVDLGVFPMLSEKEDLSAGEIAVRTGADKILIRRLLRTLAAYRFVAERDAGVYGVTRYTVNLSKGTTVGMVKFIYDLGMPTFARAPSWFQEKGYQSPGDPKHGVFQSAFACEGEEIFPSLQLPGNEAVFDSAQSYFEGDRGSRPSWAQWFPIREKLLGGDLNTETPLLVDVAGGRGHDLMEFRQAFKDEPGRLILHDTKPVPDSATALAPEVEKVALDFFQEAPVRGARIYFLKFIMHDYSDADFLRILAHIKQAMTPGYSYLVVNDFILPETGCHQLSAQWDLMVMLYMSGLKRTESQWKNLMNAAGLDVDCMHQSPGDAHGILMATLK